MLQCVLIMKNSSKWNFKGGLEGAPQQLRVEQKGHYSVTCPYFAYLSRQQMFERIFHGFRTKHGLERWFTIGNLPAQYLVVWAMGELWSQHNDKIRSSQNQNGKLPILIGGILKCPGCRGNVTTDFFFGHHGVFNWYLRCADLNRLMGTAKMQGGNSLQCDRKFDDKMQALWKWRERRRRRWKSKN